MILRSLLIDAVFAVIMFTLGYISGLASQKPQQCPQVQGGRVLQTINSKDGQMCVFIAEPRVSGKTVRVRL